MAHEQHRGMLDLAETYWCSTLQNALHSPASERYRQLRVGNRALQERLLRWDGAEQVLQAVGFRQMGKDGDAVLYLERPDAELLLHALETLKARSCRHL